MKKSRDLMAIFDVIVDSLAIFAGALLVLVMLSVTMDVILRYFFSRPQSWVGELSEYALLYITFAGTAWVLKRDQHVKIDILIAALSPKKRKIFNLPVCIIGIFVCAILTYYGVKVTWDHFARGVCNVSLMEFPKGPLLAVIPVGMFLLLIQFIRRFYQSLKELRMR